MTVENHRDMDIITDLKFNFSSSEWMNVINFSISFSTPTDTVETIMPSRSSLLCMAVTAQALWVT